MTAIPARVAGVADVIAVCPRPEPAVLAAALEAGVSRLFRIGGAHAIAALAYGTRDDPARRQDRRPGQSLRGRGEGLRRGRLRDRLLRRSDRNRHRRRRGPPGMDRRGPDRAGGARPGCAGDFHHLEAVARGSRRRRRGAPGRGTGDRRDVAHRERRRGGDAYGRRGDRAGEPHRPGAPGRRSRGAGAARAHGRRRLRRPVHGAGRGRLRDRVEPRAADVGRIEIPRRTERRPISSASCRSSG